MELELTPDEASMLIGLLTSQAVQIGSPDALAMMTVAESALEKLRAALGDGLDAEQLELT